VHNRLIPDTRIHLCTASLHCWSRYTATTPYGFSLEAAHAPAGVSVSPENLSSLLGTKTAFPDLYNFFDAEVNSRGLQQALQAWVPVVMAGCAGSLTHGVIHLGWGLDAGNHCMTVEGAALVHCHAGGATAILCCKACKLQAMKTLQGPVMSCMLS
jgi:hypothetical protein